MEPGAQGASGRLHEGGGEFSTHSDYYTNVVLSSLLALSVFLQPLPHPSLYGTAPTLLEPTTQESNEILYINNWKS